MCVLHLQRRLGLFQDFDFARDPEDSKSTSSGHFRIIRSHAHECRSDPFLITFHQNRTHFGTNSMWYVLWGQWSPCFVEREVFSNWFDSLHFWWQWSLDWDHNKRPKSHNETCVKNPQSCFGLVVWQDWSCFCNSDSLYQRHSDAEGDASKVEIQNGSTVFILTSSNTKEIYSTNRRGLVTWKHKWISEQSPVRCGGTKYYYSADITVFDICYAPVKNLKKNCGSGGSNKILRQDLRVFWKLMNPQDCVWENHCRPTMKTMLREKVKIHYSTTIWFTKLFLSPKS